MSAPRWSVRPGRYAEDDIGNRFYVVAFKTEGRVLVESVATKERFLAPIMDLTRVVLEGEKS